MQGGRASGESGMWAAWRRSTVKVYTEVEGERNKVRRSGRRRPEAAGLELLKLSEV